MLPGLSRSLPFESPTPYHTPPPTHPHAAPYSRLPPHSHDCAEARRASSGSAKLCRPLLDACEEGSLVRAPASECILKTSGGRGRERAAADLFRRSNERGQERASQAEAQTKCHCGKESKGAQISRPSGIVMPFTGPAAAWHSSSADLPAAEMLRDRCVARLVAPF
jgi:hypothetical protein